MSNQLSEIKTFDGVMDQDSALWSVGPSNSRYCLNLINIYNQLGTGTAENVRSTVQVINSYITTNGSKTIGAFEDVRDNSVIFFLYSPNNLHGIFRWYQNKGGVFGEIEKIYQVQDANNDPLRFSPDRLITGCSLVDNILYWSEGGNPPMSINTIKANQTNKNKFYNLYFNDSQFGIATTYTINLYEPNVALPIFSFSWTSSGATYSDKVNDLINAANNTVLFSTYLLIEDLIQYARLTLVNVGDYHITVNDAFLIAENFYPDVTPTTVSYAPLNQELITAVKYPPMCEPKAEYANLSSGDSLFAQYIPLDTQILLGTDHFGFIGMNNNSISPFFDNTGLSVLGPSNITSVTSSSRIYQPPLSYLENTTANPITLSVTINLTVLNKSGVGSTYLAFSKYTNISTIPADKVLLNFVNPIDFITQSFTVLITILPAERYALFFESSFGFVSFSTTIFASEIDLGLNTNIAKNAYQFRAKYIYDNLEQSVYGAISNIPLPTNEYQDIINIDYTDPRLESVELASEIKEVVLCLSFDNGVTWFDFKRLQPFEFVGQGRQKYIFNGKESLIAVAEAEAILPYHNIPLKALSQEFIDDRIFYGGITTGYDKVEANMRFDIEYTDTSSLANLINTAPYASKIFWRRGGQYVIGIEYLDDADRKTPVIIDPINSRIKIPFYNEGGINTDFPANIKWSIFHNPPDWATKYQLVRTKDLTQTTYLQFTTNGVTYENIEGGTATMALAAYVVINVENIAYYQDKTNIGAKISFPYVNGDRVRFIKNKAGVYYSYNDHEIIKVDGQKIYIVNDGSIVTSNTPTDTGGDWIEFYSPNTGADDTLFYEFGECLPIENITDYGVTYKAHIGEIQDQYFDAFGFPVTPAIGYANGDVFYRTRRIPYQTFTPPPDGYTINFMSANTPSEFIEDTFYNNGRVNSSELLGQVYQPTGLLFTDRYVSGTRINGLNAVQPANTRQYSTIYGAMTKMQVVNNDILRLIFANGWMMSIYVNQGVIRQGQGGQNLISVYDDVAGNSHIIQRTFGSLNGESVAVNDEGDLFGWDGKDGTVWLSSSSQTVAASDFLMKNTFNNYGIARRGLDQLKSQVPAIYDLGKDLYTITFAPLAPRPFIAPTARVKLADFSQRLSWNVTVGIEQNIYNFNVGTPATADWFNILLAALPRTFTFTTNSDGSFNIAAPTFDPYNNAVLVVTALNIFTGDRFTYNFRFEGGQEAGVEQPFEGVTLAFSRKRKGWTQYFSFVPEMYGRLGNQLISFKEGEMWLHDRGADYNNFYGVQYGSSIKFVLNKDYPKVKVPLAVWYRGIGRLGCKVSTPQTDSYPTGSFTEMLPELFTLEDNGYYSEVLKNKLDPRFTNPNEAWVNGDDIRGDVAEIELYSNENSLVRLDSQRTTYLYSENS